MNNSDGSEVPTLSLYFVIVDEIIFGPSCDVWAMSFALRTATMVAAIVLLIIYVYVVAVIIKNFKKLNNPFYICVLSMSVCDFIILLTSMQEARVQSCVLGSSPARQIAWQTIGTLSLDGILTNGFVLALTRFVTIFFLAKESFHWSVAKYGCAASWLWTIIAATLNHFSLVSKIWFEEDGYHDRFLFPFQYVHFFMLLVSVGGVFVLYLVSFVKLTKLRKSNNGLTMRSQLTQELRILVQCLIIFAGELLYLYATFWFGLNYLHLGSSIMNARLNYLVRPLQGGINPILYLTFSSEIRGMAFPCFTNKISCFWNKVNPHSRIHNVEFPKRLSVSRQSSGQLGIVHE